MARGSKHQVTHDWRLDVFERQGWKCAYCGRDFSTLPRRARRRLLTVDHVVPTCRGGTDEDANLVAACERCNAMKGNRTAAEWRAGVAKRHCFGRPLTDAEIYHMVRLQSSRSTRGSPTTGQEEACVLLRA